MKNTWTMVMAVALLGVGLSLQPAVSQAGQGEGHTTRPAMRMPKKHCSMRRKPLPMRTNRLPMLRWERKNMEGRRASKCRCPRLILPISYATDPTDCAASRGVHSMCSRLSSLADH
jgi:hypothetical protein